MILLLPAYRPGRAGLAVNLGPRIKFWASLRRRSSDEDPRNPDRQHHCLGFLTLMRVVVLARRKPALTDNVTSLKPCVQEILDPLDFPRNCCTTRFKQAQSLCSQGLNSRRL